MTCRGVHMVDGRTIDKGKAQREITTQSHTTWDGVP